MKYDHIQDGKWIYPAKRGYRLACCDCGLVHRIDFAHVPHARGRRIIFRAFRDPKATAALRRQANPKTQGAP